MHVLSDTDDLLLLGLAPYHRQQGSARGREHASFCSILTISKIDIIQHALSTIPYSSVWLLLVQMQVWGMLLAAILKTGHSRHGDSHLEMSQSISLSSHLQLLFFHRDLLTSSDSQESSRLTTNLLSTGFEHPRATDSHRNHDHY
jgi:hypothetical protein